MDQQSLQRGLDKQRKRNNSLHAISKFTGYVYVGPSCQGNFFHSPEQQTVHSPLFFRRIIEIERFALRDAILHECQNYLSGGGGLGGSLPRATIPDACPFGTIDLTKKQGTVNSPDWSRKQNGSNHASLTSLHWIACSRGTQRLFSVKQLFEEANIGYKFPKLGKG